LAPGVERQTKEVRDRDTGHLDGVLEGQVEALAGALVGLHLEDRLALEQDVAARHLVLRVAGDDLRERRLARAVRAHQRVHLAPRDHQVHALEDLVAADDAGTKVTDLQRLVVHSCTSPGGLRRPRPRWAVSRTRSDLSIARGES